ncbi:pimeloyl-ACP methyl ester carboxylesterase [Sinobaca qinghaiensis]|uniref:Pimeloyl-ACP methyl ester carboxylesterase n=1 Tax=Sinobaca qinghaiensis TaxID=342944 RepID=A0A419V509_9BACL|nr:alpha/beta hydrolase [Sinobaca qinghaiensis]RKD73609.1 pimeloyl-ACP methyl ester carboxylesterase [Sinobaca qinghaiensis]
MSQTKKYAAEEWDHQYAEVNGITVHYVQAGTNTAKPVLLLHGFPQSWLIWRDLIPKLAEDHYVLALDLRGYGDSSRPEGIGAYDNEQMAADVHGLVQLLELEHIAMIGHDRGARIARRYALDYPEKLAGVGLIDILPLEYIYDHLTAGEAAEKYWHWIFQVVPDVPEALIEGKEEVYLEFFFKRSPHLMEAFKADGAWEEYLRTWQKKGSVQAALNDYRASYRVDLPKYRDKQQNKERVEVPVMLLWGDSGNLAGQPVVDIWKQKANSIVMAEEVKDCGHYVPEEQPDVTHKHIQAFTADLFST